MSHLAIELLGAWLHFPFYSFSIRPVLTPENRKKDVLWKWAHYICATTYYPPNISGRTSQCIWPLFLYHISLPVGHSTFPLPLYQSLTFPTRPVSRPCLFFFCLIDRSICKHSLLCLFFLFALFDSITPISVCFCLDPSTMHMVCNPSSFSYFCTSLPPSFPRSVRPPQMKSGSTCRRWGSSTSVSLSMSSATVRWCCRTWARAPRPHRAPCSLAPLTAW